MFYNRFPYTDLQQKNLDWMIQTIKDGETAVEAKIEEADTAIENAEAATEAANTAKTGADDAATAANNAATAANNAKDAANTAAAHAEASAVLYGSPLTSTTVAGMTDHTRIYVYTGTEVGYTAGNWYYWNGTAWTSGGSYVPYGTVCGDYSSSSQYHIGDYAVYAGNLYRCIYEIKTTESWTAAHWTQVTVCDDLEQAESDLNRIYNGKLLEQSDLATANSNFVIDDGRVYATVVGSPYNCMIVDTKRLDFKYRRRSSDYQLFIGIAVGGNFVGNVTNQVVNAIKTIYGTTNVVYSDATVLVSVADNDYSDNYHNYTATLDGSVFELQKDGVTIFKFEDTSGSTIDGIAVLNYKLTYYSQTTNTDMRDCQIVTGEIFDMENDIKHNDLTGLPENHKIVAGVIRNTGSGWEFIVNGTHAGDMNLTGVGIALDGRLYIDHSSIHAKKVISLVACPDEAFAAAGYLIGASVGTDKSYIQIYQTGLNAVNGRIKFATSDDDIVVSVENADGITSAVWNDDSKTVDITHDSISNKTASTAPVISVEPALYGKYLIRLYSYSATSSRFEFIDTTTGLKVTTPDTGMSFNFGRTGTALVRNEIDANTLISANGNIWIYGIFET